MVGLMLILNYYKQDVWNNPPTTMPEIFELFLQREGVNKFPEKRNQVQIKLRDISIFPERIFIPFRYGEDFKPTDVEADTVTIHWFGGSWLQEDIFYFLKNKAKFSRHMGDIKK